MKWFIDTVERVLRSAAVAWLTWWSALSTHDIADLYSHQAVLMATGAAVGALLLSLAAKPVGSSDTASFVAKPVTVTRTVYHEVPAAPVEKAAKKRPAKETP